jgi:hypothetical protein
MASLIQRSNGFYYLVTYLNGKRIWQSTGSKTKPGAIRFIKSRKRKSKKPNNLTLSQFKTQYVTFAAANLAPSTDLPPKK